MTRHRSLIALTLVVLGGLVAAACGDDTTSTDGSTTTTGTAARVLDGTTWVVQRISVDGRARPVVPGTTVTLAFADDRLTVNAGCNTMSGPTRFDGATFAVTALASTEMACDRDRMDQDEFLARFLRAPVTVGGDRNRPQLTREGTTLDLGATPPQPDVSLRGTVWMLDTLIDGDTASSVTVTRRPTLSFTDDGRVEVFFGCNRGGGTVEVADATLTFGPLAMTRMACEPEAMGVEAEVARLLTGTTDYDIDGARLTITAAGRGAVWAAQLPD